MSPAETFHRYVFQGEQFPKADLEAAAFVMRHELTPQDRSDANEALLSRLADAKDKAGPHPCRDLLKVPEISTLVNLLVAINEGWLMHVLHQEKERLRLKEPVEELTSQALVGKNSLDADAGGMISGILKFDYRQYGIHPFTSYLSRAISNALKPTPKQKHYQQSLVHQAQPIEDQKDCQTCWVDRHTRSPVAVSIDHDLIGVLRDVISRLPPSRELVATYIVDHVLKHGTRPGLAKVAALFGVTRERARQLAEDTLDRIGHEIEARYPQLAEGGINRWKHFKEAIEPAEVAGRGA